MSRQVLIKEIIYRAQHRGLRELDLTCMRLTPNLLEQQEDSVLVDLRDLLLIAADQDLLNWLTSQEDVHPDFDNAAFALLKKVHQARHVA